MTEKASVPRQIEAEFLEILKASSVTGTTKILSESHNEKQRTNK